MLLKKYSRFLLKPLVVAAAACMIQPAMAGNLADKVADTVAKQLGNIPVEILPADKPDAVILRGGPVSNELANKISLSAAKVEGVNELINEMEIS